MMSIQLRQIAIAADNKRLDDKRNTRLMAAPDLTQTFSHPYEIERFPKHQLPSTHAPRKMTYDEADEQASIAASELVGTNGHEYGALKERLLDELCVKHDIE